MKTFFVNTYGCQMNEHESEKIAGILQGRGLTQSADINTADIIVYNTCCIRESAEAKVFGHLGIAKKIKELRPSVKVVLCGCMPQQKGAAESIKKRFPFINLIIGTHNINLLGEYLDRLQDKKRVFEIWDSERDVPEVNARRGGKLSAWLNIMYGCNNFCSYCIVPYVRGRERSRPCDSVLKEAQGLLDAGYKEITLLGQNVNSYRHEGKGFADLLKAVGGLNPQSKFRLRFTTSHPKDFSQDIVSAMGSNDNISKFVHLAVQSGSDRVLSAMNRKYTAADYLKKIEMIRKAFPFAGISTDIMVGFPSETEEEFEQTLELVKKVRFDNIFTFVYNRRKGTPADQMAEQIPQGVKSERIERLIKLQFEIGVEKAKEANGRVYEVLCESVDGGIGFGKADNGDSVKFNCDKDLTGQFLQVKITGAKNTTLTGEMQ